MHVRNAVCSLYTKCHFFFFTPYLAHHGVRLSTARLPVSKNGGVVPLQHILHGRMGDVPVHGELVARWREDMVKGEVLVAAIDPETEGWGVGVEGQVETVLGTWITVCA